MSNHNDKNKLNSGEGLPSNVEVNPEPSQICRICKKLKTIDNFHKNKTNKNGVDYRCKPCRKLEANNKRFSNYFQEYLRVKKSECKSKEIDFDLTSEHLEEIWTGICPIFNIDINYNNKGKGSYHINQAHLDRFNPEYGYIKGNVMWISGRANRIKYNATIDELEKILTYMKGATTIPKGSTLK